jgi:hypothetical protein
MVRRLPRQLPGRILSSVRGPRLTQNRRFFPGPRVPVHDGEATTQSAAEVTAAGFSSHKESLCPQNAPFPSRFMPEQTPLSIAPASVLLSRLLL